jgi:hypothetical protein
LHTSHPEERGSESSYDPEELGSELSYDPEECGSEASYDPDEQVDPVSVENVDAVSELCLLFQELRL